MPRIPLRISNLNGFGLFDPSSVDLTASPPRWTNPSISLDRASLEQNPAIISAVHEIGHFLDAHGFGDGVPLAAVQIGELASATDAFSEWRTAVYATDAYSGVSQNGSLYAKSTVELLARSYEQYIATRADNAVLWAKIRKRQEQDGDYMYWSDSDFEPVARAFDRLFATRGLRDR